MADWLLAALDAAGVTQAALVGHSMGSLIALEAAARAPQRVTHLALLGTAYPMKVAERCWTRRATTKRRPSAWSPNGRTVPAMPTPNRCAS
jgi:pimeloyl-ACP methyl ester carboxylesterase